MTASTVRATPVSTSIFRPARILGAAGIALAANLAAFGVGNAAGASWDVGQPYPISGWAVALATLVAFAVGGLATWLGSRWRPGFQRFAAWAGLALGLVSMAPLLGAADLATGLSLGFMHLVAASLWLWTALGKGDVR